MASFLAGCAGSGSKQAADAGASSTATSTTSTLPITSTVPAEYKTIVSALGDAGKKPVRILVIGDSRMVVDATITPGAADSLGVTFGNRFVDLLRTTLQARYGSHGTGIVPVFWAYGSDSRLPNQDYWSTSAALGQECSLGPHASPGVYCFYAALPAGASLSFDSHDVKFDHIRAFCERTSASGTLQVTIDGHTPETICSGTSPDPAVLVGTSASVSLATHTTVFSCMPGGNACLLGAVDGVAGTAGVSIDNFSVGGAALGIFASDPTTQFAIYDAIPESHQLLVEGHLTNEPGIGETPAQFQAELNNLIAHERSLPTDPSIELVRLLQDNINPAGQALFSPLIAETATENATGYADVTAGVGTEFIPSYFGPDGAHENNAGNQLNFQVIAAPLLNP